MKEISYHEDSLLAPYAVKTTDWGGRYFQEEEQPFRTCYQRDRDRIIYSKAFRRLGYKTQVFANSAGDNYRTRLTHSLEVAQLSRTVAGFLSLNRDYAEALALAHDLGHTPFGHSGQEALHQLMKDSGGFEHNCQSLRIVCDLESRYLNFKGLNLTAATLKGMMKHEKIYQSTEWLNRLCEERKNESPYLESHVVDLCDRIAYVHHDLEDGLDSGYLIYEELFSVSFFQSVYERIKNHELTTLRREVMLRIIIREMMNEAMTDLMNVTRSNLDSLKLISSSQVLALARENYPVTFSDEMKVKLKELSSFLTHNLYRHPHVMQMSRRGCRMIETLFEEYYKLPSMMPVHIQQRIDVYGLERTIADYISGMTDRFAASQFAYITGYDV